jgi:hypothetical protein
VAVTGGERVLPRRWACWQGCSMTNSLISKYRTKVFNFQTPWNSVRVSIPTRHTYVGCTVPHFFSTSLSAHCRHRILPAHPTHFA